MALAISASFAHVIQAILNPMAVTLTCTPAPATIATFFQGGKPQPECCGARLHSSRAHRVQQKGSKVECLPSAHAAHYFINDPDFVPRLTLS